MFKLVEAHDGLFPGLVQSVEFDRLLFHDFEVEVVKLDVLKAVLFVLALDLLLH